MEDWKPREPDPLADLVRAVSEGDVAAARGILERTPALASTPHKGVYPLHFAAIHDQHAAVDLLIEFGADLDVLDDDYAASPMGWANEKGHIDMVGYLRGRGATVTLHTACAFGMLEDARRLVAEHPDQLNALVGFGTPLHLAALWGHDDVVGMLIEAGADAGRRNGDGDLPLTIAERQVIADACHTPIVTPIRRSQIIAGCRRSADLLRPVTPVYH